ncbi:MAG: AAA family ATPase [Pseudonocardiaceae bacterium]
MRFTILPVRERPPSQARGAFLVTDNWDDFHYRTMFFLWYCDDEGVHDIGQVKIGEFGMVTQRKPSLPGEFRELGDAFFSLGQDDSYYKKLRDLGDEVRETALRALRDVALDQVLFQRAVTEDVTRISLLRSVQRATVEGQYHRIATGGATATAFRFSYEGPPPVEAEGPRLTLSFAVEPESYPPTNVHALIGSNGVGKTRLLNRLARSVADGSATTAEVGEITDLAELADSSSRPFANMVSVCFSAFDPFTPVRTSNGIEHAYITLNRGILAPDRPQPPKDYRALTEEFGTAVRGLTGARLRRWQHALTTLETDPLFDIIGLLPGDAPRIEPEDLFTNLSSGHKIVLLTITRLADLVTERTLVLIDEPETHLHPPLLAAFIRAVSELLIDRNGVAIIATHSPVVLQETPRSCVWKLRRSGHMVKAERPEIETFGENVGVLTREAFGLEVTRSGFHRMLEKVVQEGLTFQQVIDRFEGQLGGEASGIVRALIAVRDHEGHS